MSHALQCPRCNGAVSVPDHAAGKRVKCPHCDETFLAPGVTAKANDDDDWLKLDSDPVAADELPDKPPAPIAGIESLGKKPPQPTGGAKKSGLPKLSFDDEAVLAEFTSDLDEFTAEIESPPAPLNTPLADADPFRGLPAMSAGAPAPAKGSAAPSPRALAPAAAEPVEYQSEYRINCSVCGSLLYVKAEQAGKTIKCSDCYSPITIPAPPKVRKKQTIDLDRAETFSLEHREVKERRDPYQKSADQLLEEASREEEKKSDPKYDDIPSVKEWAKNVFGIFLDPGVLVHWLGLSVFAAVPTFLALSMDTPIIFLALFPAGFFLGTIVVGCGFAILQSVANEEESVSDWPALDPLGWLGQLFVVFSAAMLAAVPAWAVSQFALGPNLFAVAITMLSVYSIFPFVLLSMLDMQSAFVPFSAEVARSVTKCEEAWGGFYFSSGLLFGGLFLVFTMAASMSPPIGGVIAILAGIAITFTYFAMIGRLAYSIGQAVNAPPMRNDIDRSQKSRSRDGAIK